MRMIPHALSIGGKTIRILWGNAEDRYWQRNRFTKERPGLGGLSRMPEFTITLHPRLRLHPEEAMAVWHTRLCTSCHGVACRIATNGLAKAEEPVDGRMTIPRSISGALHYQNF